ncbi:MAG: O-antigen ligase family protein [Gudongella sp.]|nr:O-antigen ligase family protein [Gudongella sp.]
MSKKRAKQNKSNSIFQELLKVAPLIAAIAIIPLIVFLKVVPPNSATLLFTNGGENFDFFSYYKMVWLLIFTAIGLLMFITKFATSRKSPLNKTKLYYPMAGYLVLVLLSTIFAQYKGVAVQGFVDRYEGIWVLFAYIAIVFLGINLVEEEKQLKYILTALGLSVAVMTVLGLTQFVGKDFLMTSFGKKLILPKQLEHIADELNFTFARSKAIYATLYNINFVGVYMSMVFALSSTMFLTLKDKRFKFFFLAVSLMSFMTILGSRSRAAMFGVIFYVLLVAIMLRKQLFIHWKSVLVMLVLAGAILFGVNTVRDGLIKDRFLAGLKSITATREMDLEDIVFDDDKVTIVFNDYSMTIESLKDGFLFLDSNGNPLEMEQNDSVLNTLIEPYSKHRFEIQIHNDNPVLYTTLSTSLGRRSFRIVSDSGQMKAMYYDQSYLTDLKSPYFGFEGREGMASSRGYIWSRTIPMLKETIIIGHGPDTYALHFPHYDYVGKFKGFTNINQIVDKPHNMYLQMAVNTGILSVLALMALWGMYLFNSFKLYFKRPEYNTFTEAAGLSISLAVAVYLFTGLTNDSLISVAPVFWTLLGLGIWANKRISE